MIFTHNTVLENDSAKPMRAIFGSDDDRDATTTVTSPTRPMPTRVEAMRCKVAVAQTSRLVITRRSKVSPMVNNSSVTPTSLTGCNASGAVNPTELRMKPAARDPTKGGSLMRTITRLQSSVTLRRIASCVTSIAHALSPTGSPWPQKVMQEP